MTREKKTCEIKIGHAIDNLRKIPDESVDLVVTSPPYWGLRDYKTEPVVFGRDPDCECNWDDDDDKNGWDDQVPQTMSGQDKYADSRDEEGSAKQKICSECGAWSGQLGLEASPELFVEHLVEIFEECRRILKPTGNLWVNLGDSYMRKQNYKAPKDYGLQKHRDEAGQYRPSEIPTGYKRKDLVGLPWLFAFAARSAGWYLRNDIVWAKSISGPHYRGGVCMPEPIKDRCTRSHEFFFHFTKKSKYYYDVEATAEPLADPTKDRYGGTSEFGHMTRNMRTVWHFNPQPYDGAHFAVYPKHLIEPIVRASTSEYGCCADCGVPWVRDVEHTRIRRDELDPSDPRYRPNQYEGAYEEINGRGDAGYSHTVTKGWRPNCECHGKIVKREVTIPGRAYQGDWKRDADSFDGVAGNHGGNTGLQELAGKWGADSNGEYNGVAQKDYTSHMAEDASEVKSRIIENLTKAKTKNIYVYESDMPLDEHPVKPAVVLDPFSGSGTSGIVALEHGRSYIGIELNPEYAALSERRLKQERTGMTAKKYRDEAVCLKEYW